MQRGIACVAVVSAAIAGCRSKQSERDCDGYANKVADLSDPAPGKRDQIVEFSVGICKRGRISDRELSCVERASSRAELIECTTGSKPIDAGPPPPPAKGTNAVTLYAAQNREGNGPFDFALNDDQRQWYEAVKKAIANCATDEVYDPPRQYVVEVIYSSQSSSVSLGQLQAPLSVCVKDVLSRRPAPSAGQGVVDYYIDVGK